jgi:outer membrane receptor for ferric coprogen and ferric-rhodotorulic acid
VKKGNYGRRPLALAIHVVLLSTSTGLLLPAQAADSASATYDNQAQRPFDIAAGPLAETLSRFASSAGVALSFDAALLKGRQSPGLQGRYTVAGGFAALLAGSGLQAKQQSNGSYALVPAPAAGALELDATNVTSQLGTATTEGSHSYTSNVVTMGKGEHALKDIPQSVSVITRQRMDDQNLNTLDEVLEQSTGVTTFQSPSGGKYVYSRGFEVDTYQYDGVAMNRRFYTRGNSFVADTLIYDRVELLRGANGLLQGSGGPGAAINLVRKRPKAEPAVALTASAGSWDTYRQSIDASSPLTADGALRARVVAGHEDRDYFYDTAESRKNVLYGILEYEFTPATVLAVGASVEDLKSTPFFGGLPRNQDGSGTSASRSTFYGADWNKWNNKQVTYFSDLTHDFNADWRLKVAGSYVRETNDMLYAFSRGAVNETTGNGLNARSYLYDFENTNKAIDINLTGKWRAFEREHEVIVGASANDLKNDDLMAGNYTIPLFVPNIYHPVSPPEPSENTLLNLPYSAYTDGRIRQNGVYGVVRYKLADPLTAVLGGRVSHYTSTFDSTSVLTGETTPSKVKETGVVTPYAGLIYALNEQWSAYVSYADIFQPQTDLTEDKQTIKPIVGSNYELGLKGELLDGRVNTSFAIFRIDQENRAQYDENDFATAGGEVRAEGFEAEISGEVLSDLQLFAGYTYTSTTYLKDNAEEGSTFNSYTPRHMLRLWADYQLPGDWRAVSVGAGGSIQSENWNSNFGAGDIVQPGYAIWNARVGYRFNEHFSAFVNGNNLFDKRYYSTVGHLASESHFGEPRNYTLTLKADF